MKEFPLFAQRLREERNKRGITQMELAKLTNTTATTISGYENGCIGKVPSLEVVSEIAFVLNVSMDYLLGLDDKNSANPLKANREGFYKALITVLSGTHTYYECQDGLNTAIITFLVPNVSDFINDFYKIQPLLSDDTYDEFIKNGLIDGLLKKYATCTEYYTISTPSSDEEQLACNRREDYDGKHHTKKKQRRYNNIISDTSSPGQG